MEKSKLHLSFSGAGFLGIYHVGVVKAFKDYFPEILDREIIGTSAGSLTAAGICCSIPPSSMVDDIMHTIYRVRSQRIGILTPNFSLPIELKILIKKNLPIGSYKKCQGRLHISITRWRTKQNEIVSDFIDDDDLIDALVCSSHIPLFSGITPVKFRGKFYWDGGVSNLCPRLNKHTITVSPFSSPSVNICPRVNQQDANKLVFTNGLHLYRSDDNISRFQHSLFPSKTNGIKHLLCIGYDNAVEFMIKEGIIVESIPGLLTDTNTKNYDKTQEKSTEPNFAESGTLLKVLRKIAYYSVKISYEDLGPAETVIKIPILILSDTAKLLSSYMRNDVSNKQMSLIAKDDSKDDSNDDIKIVSEDINRHGVRDLLRVIEDFDF